MVSVRAFDRSYVHLDTTPSGMASQAPKAVQADAAANAAQPQGIVPESVSYISSPSWFGRAWARLTGRAYSAFPPAPGANTPFNLVRTYYQHGLDGVVEALWRRAPDNEEFSYGWVAGQLVVCLRSPEILHAAFTDNSERTSRLFPDYAGPFGGLYRIFGNNVFTKHDQEMRQARQVVMHRFFIRRNIQTHFDKILNTADKHIDALLHSQERATPDVGKCMVAFTMDTWCRAQLGMPGLDVAAAMRLSQAISDGEALATSAKHLIWRGVLQRLGVRDLQTIDADELKLRDKLFVAIREELIDPYRATLDKSDNLLRDLAESEAQAGRDGTFEADAVMSELAVLLLTGHETAASLLTWTLCELARNPSSLAKLRAEVTQVFGDRPPTAQSAEHTPFLDQVLKEALRLHPPAPYLGRTVTQAFTVPTRHGPVTFPKATVLATSLIAQHRIPQKWGDDAEAFRPERFAGLSRETLDTQFLPFSVGNRRCAGYPFAMLEAKIFLVRLLQRTDFELPGAKAIEPVYVGVLKTAEPLRMEVAEATGGNAR